ncbi:MAG TPA: hypothetical protein VHU19_12120 [Pyrinomonadaceae bacterium]|jgi:hypothetical protein|nr:hypothetical protein [Pyrinomonadaceae bacterium]
MKTHPTRKADPAARCGERGYSLIALLAMMTLLMIAMMAAAPSLRQQSRRERELEAIARGEEVAEAIRMYVHYAHRLPTSMEELQKGAPVGTKNVQVLRASAALDPLSESGEWRLIKANDRPMISFIQALTTYTDGHLPQPTTDAALAQVANLPRVTGVLDIETVEDSSGSDDDSLTSTGPFVGVASRSHRESIITYYGIDHHNGWVFTPFYR